MLRGNPIATLPHSQDTQSEACLRKDTHTQRLEDQVRSLEAEVTSCRRQLLHQQQAAPQCRDPPSTPPTTPSPHHTESASAPSSVDLEERLQAVEVAHASRYAALRRQCLAATAQATQRGHEVGALKQRLQTLQAMCSGYERTVNSLLGLSQPSRAGTTPPSLLQTPPQTEAAAEQAAKSPQGSFQAQGFVQCNDGTGQSRSLSPPDPPSPSEHASEGKVPRVTSPANGARQDSQTSPAEPSDEDSIRFFPSPELVAAFSVDAATSRLANRPPRPGQGGYIGGVMHAAGNKNSSIGYQDSAEGDSEEEEEGGSWGAGTQDEDDCSDGAWSHGEHSDRSDEVHMEHWGEDQGGDCEQGSAKDDEDAAYWESLGRGLKLPLRSVEGGFEAGDPGDDHQLGVDVHAAVQRIQAAGATPDGPRRRSPLATCSPESAGTESSGSGGSANEEHNELLFHSSAEGSTVHEAAQHSQGSSLPTEDDSLESDDLFAYEREALQEYEGGGRAALSPGMSQQEVVQRPQLALPEGGGMQTDPLSTNLSNLSDGSWSPSYSPVTPVVHSARSAYSVASSEPVPFPVLGGADEAAGGACPAQAGPRQQAAAPPALQQSGIPRRRRVGLVGQQHDGTSEQRAYVVPRTVQLTGTRANLRLQAGSPQQ